MGWKIRRAVLRDRANAIQKAPNSVVAAMAAKRRSPVQTSLVSDSTTMLPTISPSRKIEPDDAQVVALEHGNHARTRRGVVRRHAGRKIGAHVGGEQHAVAREQPRVEDVLVDGRRAQRFSRRSGILECQRRRAVGADDVGQHGHVADQAVPAVHVVVGRKDRAGRDQRDAGGRHGGRRELARHRLAVEPGTEVMEHRRSA